MPTKVDIRYTWEETLCGAVTALVVLRRCYMTEGTYSYKYLCNEDDHYGDSGGHVDNNDDRFDKAYKFRRASKHYGVRNLQS
jgi:hypothetical protein